MAKMFFSWPEKIIIFSFYLLFFFVPLIFTPFNYELFEYNKMMLTYAFTVVITGSWIIKMIFEKRIKINRTPLDFLLFLFLLSQIVSTFFSIDRHVSFFGYYSRFNGGLLSTLSYLLLYYAFVTNFPREKIKSLLIITLSSGLLVAFYGFLERLGIDKHIWVQDVQNRVFSTLGQPNWLAAYLAILIFVAFGILPQRILLLFLISLFYTVLLFTKSRSGFLGFWIAFIFYLFSFLFLYFRTLWDKNLKNYAFLLLEKLKLTGISMGIFLLITFFIGSPFPQINRFTQEGITKKEAKNQIEQTEKSPPSTSLIEVGITESSKIREIVWKGAFEIFKKYPFFGTGVETFAFSYYKFRPQEHNLTSEWDFLYNKAHNEYLNFAANCGIFGLGAYLLLIGKFIGWAIKRIRDFPLSSSKEKITPNTPLFFFVNIAFLAAWFSILITNFFGFSVVVIQLFFFLIPAFSFVFDNLEIPSLLNQRLESTHPQSINKLQKIAISLSLIGIIYLFYFIGKWWYADTFFASGYQANKIQDYTNAYQALKKAISLNPHEPLYYDELALPAAFLAVAFAEENEATLSAELEQEAKIVNDYALLLSPNNVNFWKTRTRVFFVLSQLNEKYLEEAVLALEKAKTLSPTDPRIRYNLGLLYEKLKKPKEAIFELEEATRLKIDYQDAYFALAFLYEKNKNKEKAKEALNFILTKLNPSHQEAKKKLEELNKL